MAIVTRDPRLYHELAAFLKERRWPTVSLLPGARIPETVAAVLTSAEEAPSIPHPNVLTVTEGADRRALAAAVGNALSTSDGQGPLFVGIDPGPRPGYAILDGGTCLVQGNLDGPETVAAFASQLRHRFEDRSIVYRVGSGDPGSRNRIVNDLLEKHRSVELVDENGTTPRGRRRPRDAAAARKIGESPGTVVHEFLTSTVTPGEIANLQRLSREGSGGRVTISRTSAHRVLRGEITLVEALEDAIPKDRPPRESRVPPGHELL